MNRNIVPLNDRDRDYLRGLLRRLQRQFALFEFVRGVLALALLALLLTASALGLDMYVHLDRVLRWGFLAAIGLAAGGTLLYLLAATFVWPAGSRWLAVKVERRYPVLKNRLITALQIAQGGEEARDFDPEFANRLMRETRDLVNRLDLAGIVPWRGLRLLLGLTVLGAAALLGLRMQWPDGFRVAVTRLHHPNTLLAPPSRTQVAVTPAGAVVAKGDNLKIAARISGRMVSDVRLHIRRPGKTWTIIAMLRDAGTTNAAPDRFVYELHDLAYPLDYFVRAGDGQTAPYGIAIVDRPRVRRVTLRYEFPAYLGLEPRTPENGQSTIEAPQGTTVRLGVETDGPVTGGDLRLNLQGEKEPRRLPLRLEDPQHLQVDFVLDKSGSYSPVVTNAAGLGEKTPPEYPLIAQVDTPPLVEILEPGRDLMLDDPQSIPVLAVARDDFGLQSIYADVATTNVVRTGATNDPAAGQEPPGQKLMEIGQPGTKVQNASLQIDCPGIPDFARTGRASYTLYAVDRKGQIGQSRTFTVLLTPKAQARVHEGEASTNDPAKRLPETPAPTPLPPEVARLVALIEEQTRAMDMVRAAQEQSDRRRPPAELPDKIQNAFAQQQQIAVRMAETRTWAEGRLGELAKNPNVQNPAFERALRGTRDTMDSLRNDEVREALDALREAFLRLVPEGTNAYPGAQPASASNAAAQAAAPAMAAKPGSPAPAAANTNAAAANPANGGPNQPAQAAPAAKLNRQQLDGLQKNLEAARRQQAEILAQLQNAKDRMEASLPGQVDETKLADMDQELREKTAAMAEQFKEGLQLAAEKARNAMEALEPLADRQARLRDKTRTTEAEQVKNLAASEDRLALDTGHAEERLQEEEPWLKPPQAMPESMPEPLEASGAPRVPIPPTPAAPRKEALTGPEPASPAVTQPPGENPMPKLLVPDRFPSTFRGKLSDKPIPPPPNAQPTGRAPSTSLRKLSDAEKEQLRKETLLDSLELLDDGKAMGLGAPANEEMPEEMRLEPGAQFASGPSAPDSKPGMELGQSSGKILGNPQQPPAGGGGGGQGDSQPSSSQSKASSPPSQDQGKSQGKSQGPPSGQPPSGQQQPPSSPSPSQGSPNQGQSQPGGQQPPSSSGGQGASGQPPPGAPTRLMRGAAAFMQQASQALAQTDPGRALAAQDLALSELNARQQSLDRVHNALEDLQNRMATVERQLSSSELNQAQTLMAMEQAMNSPAWDTTLQAGILGDVAQAQLQGLRGAIRSAYTALGGTTELRMSAGNGFTNILEWAKFNLPPHLRRELIEGLQEKGPAAYQEILNEYYRSIAREK